MPRSWCFGCLFNNFLGFIRLLLVFLRHAIPFGQLPLNLVGCHAFGLVAEPAQHIGHVVMGRAEDRQHVGGDHEADAIPCTCRAALLACLR